MLAVNSYSFIKVLCHQPDEDATRSRKRANPFSFIRLFSVTNLMKMQREAGKGQTHFHLFVYSLSPTWWRCNEKQEKGKPIFIYSLGVSILNYTDKDQGLLHNYRQFRVEEESLKLILTSHPTVTWNFNLQSLLLNRTDVFDQSLCKLSWGLSFRPLLWNTYSYKSYFWFLLFSLLLILITQTWPACI